MANEVVREAMGVFHDAPSLQAAVDELLLKGFDRAQLSLLATCRTVERKLGHLYERVGEVEDDPSVPRIAFVGCDSRAEAKGAAAAVLGYIGAVAAAGAVVASGGTLALAIAAAVAAGGAGGTLGALAAQVLDRRHARNMQEQIERGGILLWVQVINPECERKAVDVLTRHGADDVHVHDLPIPEVPRGGGVSGDLTWLGKPIRQSVLGLAPRSPRPR